MAATSRELACQTLNFQSPAVVPRDLWELPIPAMARPSEPAGIRRDFPSDLRGWMAGPQWRQAAARAASHSGSLFAPAGSSLWA